MQKILFLFSIVLLNIPLFGQSKEEARLLRFPAAYGDKVVFSYAGDLYITARSGGTARKITSHIGYEMFPRFSHDGKKLAYSAQYDGNTEVYVMDLDKGIPNRITYTATLNRDDVSDRMGPNNIVMTWTPDDKEVVFRSRQYSFNDFKGQLFKAPMTGEIAEQLPFSVAGWCSYNENGTKLAYNRLFREFRTWKYYRGGQADDIWIYDFATGKSENITSNPAQDIFPMWQKDKVYYLSDRDRTMNLFEYNITTKQTRKLTSFTDFDIKFPSLTKDIIAFENGGYIYTYDIASGKLEKITITINEDLPTGRDKYVNLSKQRIGDVAVSPDGVRMSFSARGEVFTVPAKSGVVRNLTNSSGAHDRGVEWSPDGKWLTYISDRSGEDEVYIQRADGTEAAKQITKDGAPYKYQPIWSPDSKYLLMSDRSQSLYYVDINTGKKTMVTTSDVFEINDYKWSPDSRWIAYADNKSREMSVIYLYNMETGKTQPVTDNWYDSGSPAFSPDGKYLYVVSMRDFNPTYSATEWNHSYNDMAKIYAISLKADAKSLDFIKNDESKIKEAPAAEEKKEEKDAKNKDKKNGKAAEPEKKKEEKVVVNVDFDGILDRMESLNVPAGNYWSLQPVEGGIYYGSSATGKQAAYKYYTLEDKKEKNIGSFNNFLIAGDGKKVLVSRNNDFYIEDLPKGDLDPKNKIDLDGARIWIDRHAEWQQIFNESYRQMRDFFYDPGMHGVDWKAIHDKYQPLVKYVNHRSDLTYIIGEMIGELNVGHAYVNDGDKPAADRIKTGLLGARFSRDKSGFYRIDKMLKGANWSNTLQSPLMEVGLNVKPGDYILAIDGKPVKDLPNLFAGLIGKAGIVVELTVNSKPDMAGSRKIYVKTIENEADLYYQDWIDTNISKVTAATDGKAGYLHIPNMGVEGLNQFARYFYPQMAKEGLVIDDRGNGGGNVSPMIIERLRRELFNGTMSRNAKVAGTAPFQMHLGPKVCLIDPYSASDGDIFPYQFKYYKIGPVIGQRSWGGVVGIRGTLPFVDGGSMTRPEFSRFDPYKGEWVIEGHGVDPDIEVVQDPHEEFMGNDQQLTKAIDILKDNMKNKPGQKIEIPTFPKKNK